MNQTRITSLNYLKEITGGESEIMKEFIQLFFEQIPEFVEDMKRYLADKKWKELGEVAHKAKSSVMTFGMEDLGIRLKQLQIKTQSLEGIDSYASQVEEFIEMMVIAKSELEEDFSKL